VSEIDLHLHSTASDGTCTPAQLVELAAAQGMKAIAITDHDTVSGYPELHEAGERLGIETVPGIEISTKYGVAVHILGYYIDPHSPDLEPVLNWMVHDRDLRNEKMCALMAADGLPVSYADMQQRFGEVIGRPHFAELLVELGLADSVKDAFARYVDKGQKYYVGRTILPIEDAVGAIVKAGGIAVLAHPFQYKLEDDKLRELIEYCLSLGLKGMECRYSGYGEDKVRCLEALADEYGLVKTGGSDFHGSNKPQLFLGRGIDDNLNVPYQWLSTLKTLK
jgi:predicted metal-dependent phosphoesterase TrpH